MRRFVRETAFQMARRDLARFLVDHEQEIMLVFRDELQRLDDELPEESLFIDVHIVPIGEVFLRAALRALSRFLNGDIPS